MKRYIDEKTGKIVNILEKEEANKVVKILIDYFFSGENMPSGRLNLVGFLKDFIKLGDIEDLNKIVDYIGEYKKGLKLAKEEEENFEVLHKFFRMYKDLEESKLGIEDATNYISEMTNRKEEISKKALKDMNKQDKILKVFFDNGFEFKRLAKIACEAWENNLKEQMNNGKKEVFVSLEQEIAYQDLLEFAMAEDEQIAKVEKKVEDSNKKQIDEKTDNNEKIVEPVEEKKEEKAKEETVNKVEVNVQVQENKEPIKIDIEAKKEPVQQEKIENKNVNDVKVENVDKKEEKVHTIQINPLFEDEVISGNNSSKNDILGKMENSPTDPNKITQEDINSLLGLDEKLGNNSNVGNASNKENVPKKENIVKNNEELNSKPLSNEEKTRREQGYTSNIQIFVPGEENNKSSNTVNPTEVKKATENVDLKDSVDFFNNVLDNRISRNSLLDDDDPIDGFRD